MCERERQRKLEHDAAGTINSPFLSPDTSHLLQIRRLGRRESQSGRLRIYLAPKKLEGKGTDRQDAVCVSGE